MKANAQKNTLLKNAQANAANIFFKRVFFSPSQEEFFPPLFFLFFFRHRTGTVLNPTDIAPNVNNFVDSVCKLDTTPLRTDRRASGNKSLKEMAGEVVNQTFELLINCCGRLTVRASKPPLL